MFDDTNVRYIYHASKQKVIFNITLTLFSDRYISHSYNKRIFVKTNHITMNRIKEVIKEKGLTITSLADKLGIARESLSRMIVSPSYPTLEKISTALDVPMWQLFASPEEVKGEDENAITCPHCGKKIKLEKGE